MTASVAGDCYEATARIVCLRGRGRAYMPEAQVVHGVVSGQQQLAGTRYGHAWIEEGGMVHEVANGKHIPMPKEFYYAVAEIDPGECVRYTAEEARREMMRTGHFGPWVDHLSPERD